MWNNISPKTDQTRLVVPMQTPAPNLSPLITNQMNRETVKQCFDTLTNFSVDGQTPEPWLATDWEVSDDDKNWTFDLQEGHEWHDGELVTSEDVAFSYRYHADHSPFFSGAAGEVDEIEVIDETSLAFTLEEPFAPVFAFVFNRVPIIPRHVWEDVPGEYGNDEAFRFSPTDQNLFIGSGHFELDFWDQGEEVALAANEDHFSPPEVDSASLVVVDNPQAWLSGLADGSVHLTWLTGGVDSPTILDTAEENDHLSSNRVPSPGNWPWTMNNTTAPFNFQEVRAALASAAPKQTIAEEIHKGFADIGNGLIAPSLPFWYADDQKMWGETFNGAEEGIEILEERGFVIEDDTIYYPEGEAPEQKQLEGYGCQE